VDRTLVIVKPDGVERSLIGEIIRRLEQKGLALVAGEFRTLDRATATRHYVEHEGQPYYDGLLSFITRGPVFVMVVRSLIGATNAADAAPGTIRGDLASDTRENLVHGSDSLESAIREIGIFFPQLV
jgi:nucleoside-diphosphate kinase